MKGKWNSFFSISLLGYYFDGVAFIHEEIRCKEKKNEINRKYFLAGINSGLNLKMKNENFVLQLVIFCACANKKAMVITIMNNKKKNDHHYCYYWCVTT